MVTREEAEDRIERIWNKLGYLVTAESVVCLGSLAALLLTTGKNFALGLLSAVLMISSLLTPFITIALSIFWEGRTREQIRTRTLLWRYAITLFVIGLIALSIGRLIGAPLHAVRPTVVSFLYGGFVVALLTLTEKWWLPVNR